MRYKTMIKSALATAALAGVLCLPRLAQAQTTTTTPGNPATTPFLSPSNSLVPDANNIGFTGTNFANGFSPFFGNPFTFNPFFTNPFFTGFGAPFVSTNPIPGPLNPANFAAAPPAQGGPLLGINTPAHTAGGGPVPPAHTAAAIVAPLPLNTGGGAPASTAGAATATTGPVTVTNSAPPAVTVLAGPTAPAAVTVVPGSTQGQAAAPTTARVPDSAQLAHIANRMQIAMRTQAMLPGQVVSVNAHSVRVSTRRNGKLVTRDYAPPDVYFFRGDRLLDAATAGDQLKTGDQVSVPERSGQAV